MVENIMFGSGNVVKGVDARDGGAWRGKIWCDNDPRKVA